VSPQGVILALTSDLFIVPRLQDVGRQAGFDVLIADSPQTLGAAGAPSQRRIPLTEPLEGPDAAFLRKVVDLRPALLLVDTDSRQIPWERWIQTLKTSAATWRIPILAFGPHVEERQLAAARDAGADQALPRGQLLGSLDSLIREWARVIDEEGLRSACQGGLSRLGLEGIELLNAGQYFEAHEALEHAWMEAAELEGYLYRALLQVSVAYLHVERGNYRGALKMLLRLKQWLEPLPDACRGVDLARLKTQVQEFWQALEAAGPQGLPSLDRALLKPIPLLSS
jgi:predicted metal-dependent hydrolase